MSDYTKTTNFAIKDSLLTGNPLKVIKGADIDTEFTNIATAVATKADLASPTFTEVPSAPTAAVATNTTQIATTAFVIAQAISKTGGTLTGLLKFAAGANIASASTVDLTSATGNTVHITGTTTITAFTMSAGQVMDVIFDGILTLTYHATTLNIAGGGNLKTAAGARARLFYDGTTVYLLSYLDPAAQGTVRATARWYWNGSAVVIVSSYNVTSIARNGTGDYSITFTNDLGSTNYVLVGSAGNSTHYVSLAASVYNSNSARVLIGDGTVTYDPDGTAQAANIIIC